MSSINFPSLQNILSKSDLKVTLQILFPSPKLSKISKEVENKILCIFLVFPYDLRVQSFKNSLDSLLRQHQWILLITKYFVMH